MQLPLLKCRCPWLRDHGLLQRYFDEVAQPWITVYESRHRYTFHKYECPRTHPQNFQLQHTCLNQTLSLFRKNFHILYLIVIVSDELFFAYYDRACISLIQSQHQSCEYICTSTHTIVQGCREFNFLSFLFVYFFQKNFNFNVPLYGQRLMKNYMTRSENFNFTFSGSDRCFSVWLQRGAMVT
jgi:hypothetical protein